MQSPLRCLRKSQGMTLSHVASAVDIDPANLSRIERGQQIASLDVAERFVRFFSNKINELEILYPHRYAQNTRENGAVTPQRRGTNRGK